MEIKEVMPINFLFYRTRTTVEQLDDFVSVGQLLYKEAVENSLPITGPVQWHYYNFSLNHGEPFDFEIALPVGDIPIDYDGKFHVKRTAKFRCICATHEGTWQNIPQTYSRIIEYARIKNLVSLNAAREVYLNVDFLNTDANVTEVQLGIK